MAFDIYGDILEPGFCEVHPHVRQEYPCDICMQEKRKIQDSSDKYWAQKGQSTVQFQQEHIDSLKNEIQILKSENGRLERLIQPLPELLSKFLKDTYRKGTIGRGSHIDIANDFLKRYKNGQNNKNDE